MISDCPPHEDLSAQAAEKSYRRGFDQGVAAALEAAAAGFSYAQLWAWKRRLGTWRRQSCKKIRFPEWLKRTSRIPGGT